MFGFVFYNSKISHIMLTVAHKAQNLDVTGALSDLTFFHISCMGTKDTLEMPN